jgi:hypothetical protein
LEGQNEELVGLQEGFDAFETSMKRTFTNLKYQMMQGSNMWRIVGGLVLLFVIISILFKIF